MANQPIIVVTPESTGTSAEQRWDVLLSYRSYRRHMDSAKALDAVRKYLERTVESARRERQRRRGMRDWFGVRVQGSSVLYFEGCLRYLDRCLQPRVDAWNRPDPDMLEALNTALGRPDTQPQQTPTRHHPEARVLVGSLLGMPVEVDEKIPPNEVHYRKADGTTTLLVRLG